MTMDMNRSMPFLLFHQKLHKGSIAYSSQLWNSFPGLLSWMKKTMFLFIDWNAYLRCDLFWSNNRLFGQLQDNYPNFSIWNCINLLDCSPLYSKIAQKQALTLYFLTLPIGQYVIQVTGWKPLMIQTSPSVDKIC